MYMLNTVSIIPLNHWDLKKHVVPAVEFQPRSSCGGGAGTSMGSMGQGTRKMLGSNSNEEILNML